MRQAIEQRCRELLVTRKHGDPFDKGEIGADDGRPSLVPIGNQIEEQLAADPVEGDKSKLIDLCGAPHKSINATPAVMWSEAAVISRTRTATPILTPHYW
jgi:hypothetical protein